MEVRSFALCLLALVFSIGCTHVAQLELEANWENGDVVINDEHHMTAIVGPGDRVEWACRCDPELEFTVTDLRPILDLDHLTTPDMMEALEAAIKEGPESGTEGRLEALETLAPAFFAAPRAQYQAEQNAGGPSDVPGGWSSGVGEDAYTDGTFVSPPVPQGAGLVLWKFTWRVRHKEDHSKSSEWDPHIVTHTGTSDF